MNRDKFFEQLDTLYEDGNQQAIESFLLDTSQACAEGTYKWITVMSELGGYYRGTSRLDDSARIFQEVRLAIGRQTGRQSIDYAVSTNNLAGTYRMMGYIDKALSLFREAMSIYQTAGLEADETYVALLNNMALALQVSGDIKAAEECMQQALEALRQIPGSEVENATTLSNLAALYRQANRLSDARKTAERALDIFAINGFSDNPHHAAALNLLATICFDEEKDMEAISLFVRSRELTEKIFGRNLDYAVVCESLGHVYTRVGLYQDAAESLQHAIDVYSRIPKMENRAQSVQRRLDELTGISQ